MIGLEFNNMDEIKNAVLKKLSLLKESEDHIEFKEAQNNFDYNGGSHKDPKDRRHCILGYVAALTNEKGGKLVFGMKDHRPHEVVGTTFEDGNFGALEDAIYKVTRDRYRCHQPAIEYHWKRMDAETQEIYKERMPIYKFHQK